MKVGKLKSDIPCSCDSIIEQLVEYAICDEEPFLRRFVEDNHALTIIIITQYYFRNNSTLSVTLIIDERLDDTTVEIIANGGKTGLLQISSGTEKSAVNKIAKALINAGFVEIADEID